MPTLGLTELIIILFIIAMTSVLPVIAFCRICSRTGFHWALGLLMFIPIANFILPLYIAFGEWPALKRGSTQPT